MAYLDKHNVLHRNLRARNVAVVATNEYKIDNFRLATLISLMDEFDVQQEIPIIWMPPEALFAGNVSTKFDAWSFGILLYEIITYVCEPYPGMLHAGVISRVKKGYLMTQPYGCPNFWYENVLKCWQKLLF